MATDRVAISLAGSLALALVASTAQGDTAFRTAKNGWSTEHECHDRGERTVCMVMTRGRPAQNLRSDSPAALVYRCDTERREDLYFSFHSAGRPDTNDPTLAIWWKNGLETELRTRVTTARRDSRNKHYHYFVVNTRKVLEAPPDYGALYVAMPYSRDNTTEVRFRMRNSAQSIRRAMQACGIQRSAIGKIGQ